LLHTHLISDTVHIPFTFDATTYCHNEYEDSNTNNDSNLEQCNRYDEAQRKWVSSRVVQV